MDSSSAAHRRPCQRQPTWEVEESPRGLGGVAQSIACWTQSIRAGAKKIVNDVANAGFRLHSGACDVLLVRHAEGMRSSPWHVHLGRDTCSQDAQHRLRLEIAGMEAPLTMMVGGDKKGFCMHTSNEDAGSILLRRTIMMVGKQASKQASKQAHSTAAVRSE